MADLLTPYAYTMAHPLAMGPGNGERYNFVPLDLFILRTKLSPILQREYGPVDLIFHAVPSGDLMKIVVQTDPPVVRSGDKTVLESLIQTFVNAGRDKAVVLDLSLNIEAPGVTIPNWYLNALVPRIQNSEISYDGKYLYLNLSDYAVDAGMEVVDVDDPSDPDFTTYRGDDYLEKFQKTLLGLIDLLHKMYVSGYRMVDPLEAEEYGFLPAERPEELDPTVSLDLTNVFVTPGSGISQKVPLDFRHRQRQPLHVRN